MISIALFEAGVVSWLVLCGGLLCVTLGMRGWALAAFAPAAGLSLYVATGAMALLAPTFPGGLSILALTLLAPGCLLLLRRATARGIEIQAIIAPLMLAAGAFIVALIMFAAAHRLTSVNHTDSMAYLNIGGLIFSGHFWDQVDAPLLSQRMLAVGLLHAPANTVGEYFLRLISPMIALSILALSAWTAAERLRDGVGRLALLALLVLMTVALASANRFIMHAFYINGHLLAGLFILVIAGGGWLLAAGKRDDEDAIVALQALAAAGLAVARPEGPLLAVLVLAPVLVCAAIPASRRIFLALVLGAVVALWQGRIILAYSGLPPMTTYALFAGGLTIMAGAFILRLRMATARPLVWLALVEIGLWAALAIFAERDPAILMASIAATGENILLFWGWFPILLAAAFGAAAIATSGHDRIFLRFPVTTFIPLMLLLAYLRDGAFRVGGGDSLNRMMVTILPLALLFIVSAAGSERWRSPLLPGTGPGQNSR